MPAPPLYITSSSPSGTPKRVGDVVLLGYSTDGNFAPAIVTAVSSTGVVAVNCMLPIQDAPMVPFDVGGGNDIPYDTTAASNGPGSLLAGYWIERP